MGSSCSGATSDGDAAGRDDDELLDVDGPDFELYPSDGDDASGASPLRLVRAGVRMSERALGPASAMSALQAWGSMVAEGPAVGGVTFTRDGSPDTP